MATWNETCGLNCQIDGDRELGIITSGVTFVHVREAAPGVAVLKLGMTYPLPLERIREFAGSVKRCMVIEEGDPYLFEQIRAAGIEVEQKPEMFRFGELNVARVRRILAGDVSPESSPPPGKPPALCAGCPHRATFNVLKKLDCIVAGDIGCYSLGVLPPIEAMDSLVCMGASIGMGLGLRHVLPEEQARRVVSVIGDSTFVHSGIPGLVEMVYNPPPTGHVVLILDNGTTAMTGLQEHPGTGRTLGREPTGQLNYEALSRAIGIRNVATIDPIVEPERFEETLQAALRGEELTVIVARRTCLLAAGRQRQSELNRAPEVTTECQMTYSRAPKGSENAPSPAPCPLPINIVVAGLGGQGVLTASDILAEAAFLAGYDAKKSEIHGMSQRGGSVASDVRFGDGVLSPMVPPAEADFLLVLADDQIDNNRERLRQGGVLISPDDIDATSLPNRRSANVAMLGALSRFLPIDPECWREAIRRHLKPELHEMNYRAFEIGRTSAESSS
jgi:Pyruvate/2-oxoacid:ferredoxin oxidoreductase gamma subunit/pyruvate/2-oxoacid:ferredoxin oxidoreductase beta subunit